MTKFPFLSVVVWIFWFSSRIKTVTPDRPLPLALETVPVTPAALAKAIKLVKMRLYSSVFIAFESSPKIGRLDKENRPRIFFDVSL